ncbi:transcriptional regulator, LacI family [Granulicella rosea]|uniref:Transcriptional regulator, LacI family n=1 Tax=Granulicella rosea TaxID=474952 RepID=A0A239M800_9BACT|nr:LacI family DNA-binding transcriptional regulator [Granulicella rosea]SNT38278.1 transcriptional regulator, LacI family [Granulicella rosea]
MRSSRPTVLDVARLAGVGASTVSRCLRGGPHLRPEVQERILRAIAELGYEPNEVARSLRGGRTNTIGVVFPHIANTFFSLCIQQIEQEATRRGWTVMLLSHQESVAQQSKQLAVLRRSRVDGVILTPAPGSDPEQVRKELHGMPVVALDRPLWTGVDHVMLRNREAAEMATQHLLGHGYGEIACATASPEIYSFVERIAGYRAAMARAGLGDELILAEDYTRLRAAAGEALRRRPTLRAIISLSNMATFAVVQAIRDVKHEGEREVAMIGFDDVDFATLVEPAITVVRQPTEAFGHEAVALLVQRLTEEAATPLQQRLLAAELVVRASCGCAYRD